MQANGGASYKFWGTKLSINCGIIESFQRGHIRVDMMKKVGSGKGSKKYKVHNKPFCMPIQELKGNSQYTFAHEFNDEQKEMDKSFSHRVRFSLCIEEVFPQQDLEKAPSNFGFYGKLFIDSILGGN